MEHLTNEQLASNVQKGVAPQKCLEVLYERNRPFLLSIAKKYTKFLDLEDGMQAAYFGLTEAVQKFDEARGKFLSPLSFYVRNAIRDEIRNQRGIPQFSLERMNALKKQVEELEQELFREPTVKEIAERMRLPIEEVELLRMLSVGDTSLDFVNDTEDGEGTALVDTLKADSDPETDAIEEYYTSDLKTVIWQYCKAVLSPREFEVVEEYYRQGKTLKEIAEIAGISMQRINEIKKNGIKNLRNSPLKRRLKQRLEIVEAREYSTSYNSFCDNKFSARPELIAIRRCELLAEI